MQLSVFGLEGINEWVAKDTEKNQNTDLISK